MRLTNLGIGLCVLGAIGCQGPSAPADRPDLGRPQAPAVAEAAGRASVQTFNQQMPAGYLGHPLGTVVRVTGVCVDGDTVGKLHAGEAVLHIETVNGRKLPEPVEVVFDRAAAEVPRPKPGQRFDYYVHEYGHFDGRVTAPEEARAAGDYSGNVIGIAAPRFSYSPSVTVHKSQPVR
jgi:hypothetical protein